MLTYVGQVSKKDECGWKIHVLVFLWVSYKLNLDNKSNDISFVKPILRDALLKI